jgi:hypothetical protein
LDDDSTLFITLGDDVRVCKGFVGRCLEAWNMISATDRAVVNLLAERGRDKAAQWTGYAPTRYSLTIWKTQWADGGMLFGHDALRAIDYQIAQPAPSRFINPTISSGVWQWFSTKLHARKLGIYRVDQSLLVHVIGPSAMHPKLRKQEPLVASQFVDGHQAHDRLSIIDRVEASLASIPSREKTLKQVVDSLLPQTDVVRVYLNGYQTVPKWMVGYPRVEYARSQYHGDNGDAGKFWWSATAEGYQIICDDDLIYPPGYVRMMVGAIERHDRRAVVSLHGAVLSTPVESYYKNRRQLHWRSRLDVDVHCHVLGTGVMAYHAQTVQVKPQDFIEPNMADIWMARICEQQRVPRVCAAHPPNLLTYFEPEYTIYDAARDRDQRQTQLVNDMKWAPLVSIKQ